MCEFLVTEMTVVTQLKKWGNNPNLSNRGESSSVDLSWTVCPSNEPRRHSDKEDTVVVGNVWTSSEAKKVFLKVRREQFAALVVDAGCRAEDLKEYDVIVQRYDKVLNGSPATSDTRESDTSSPESSNSSSSSG